VELIGQEAQLLTETWTNRMNAFFQLYAMHKDGKIVYSQAQRESVTNSGEFQAARNIAKGTARNRFDAVATLVPGVCVGEKTSHHHVSVCVCLYVCMYVCMHVSVCLYACVYLYVCMYVGR
jgi:hypothetical protein